MADGELKTEISADENANALNNPIFTQLSDGTSGLSVTGGVLDVNATVTLETAYVDDSAFTIGTDKVNAQGFLFDDTATDTVDEGDIGLARMTQDRLMLQVIADPTTPSQRLAVNADGSINTSVTLETAYVDDSAFTIATDKVNAQGFLYDDTATDTVDEGDIGLARMTADRLMLQVIADPTTPSQRLKVNADGSIDVNTSGITGTRVHDHDKSAATAKGATDTHTYAVANTTFYLDQVGVSGSGRIKAEIRTGTAAARATDASNVYVIFTKRDEEKAHEFIPAIEVPSTGTGGVDVVRTNRSVGSLFMYSTIEGRDV